MPQLSRSAAGQAAPTVSLPSQLTVLVTDGDERSALAAARSLLAAGCRVYVAAAGARSLGAATRGAHGLVLHCGALLDPQGFASEIAQQTDRLGVKVVLPVTDASGSALLEHRS